jgi:hypothetical protein
MPRRLLAGAAAVLAAIALIAVGVSAAGAASSGRHTKGVLYTAVTRSLGGTKFLLAGNSSDKVLGSGAVTYIANLGSGPARSITVTATVIVFTRRGSLVGKTSAVATVNNDGTVSFTKGKIDASKGQGGEAGHTFKGTFTGSGKSLTGPFVFHYAGTYK